MFHSERWHSFHSTKYNYRITELLRLKGNFGGHLVQRPLAQAQLPELVASDHTQTALEYLQGWRLHHPLFTLTVIEVFPHIQGELPVFQSVSISSCLMNGCHWKEVLLIFFRLSFQVLIRSS